MGPIQMHIADTMTSVLPELKSIHMLDSDLERFMPEEFKHDFLLGSTQIFGFSVLPLLIVENWVMDFSPFHVFVVKLCGKAHFFTYGPCICALHMALCL